MVMGCTHHPAAEGGDAGGNAPKAVVQVTTAKPRRQTMTHSLSVTGSVSPLADHEAKVAPITPGRIKSLTIQVGQHVTKGEVLATLDAGPVNGQIAQARATVSSDQEALRQSKINYTAQVASQKSAVTQAQQNLQAQRVALAKLKAGSRPQEIAQAQASVTAAQAALTNADQNLSRSQTLFSEGLLAKKDLEAAQSEELSAAAQLKSAQEGLSLAKAGNRPQDIQAAQISVDQAQEQLRVAQQGVLQNESKAEDVRIAERALENAQGALQSAMAAGSALVIRSPLDGIVTARPLNAGEWVDTSGSVASVADLRTVRLMLQVPIAQAGQIRPGMAIDFTADSNPTIHRQAMVTEIGKATDPTTNTVTVEARSGNPDLALQDDAFVHAQVVLDTHENALVVPSSALVQKDDKTVVYVIGSDNTAHEKDVTVGIQGNGMAEVSGISADVKVAITGAYELDDGTQVKTAS